jgi:uncharacterized membrane protein
MAGRRRRVHIAAMTAEPQLYMDAAIRPHRSLSKGGFVALLCLLAVYNLAVMGFLVAIGAFPVPIFLGLDFVGVIIAFRVSYRRGRALERVLVSADLVRVLRRERGAEQEIWSSPTAFTRVSVARAGEHEAEVRLRLSGRSVAVGASLSPDERCDFGSALERAILAARQERHPA